MNIPAENNPVDLYLCEVVIDSATDELCVCTGSKAHSNGVLRFKLLTTGDAEEFLASSMLRTLLVSDTIGYHAPTIGIGTLVKELQPGELWYDQRKGLLYVGYKNQNYYIGVM